MFSKIWLLLSLECTCNFPWKSRSQFFLRHALATPMLDASRVDRRKHSYQITSIFINNFSVLRGQTHTQSLVPSPDYFRFLYCFVPKDSCQAVSLEALQFATTVLHDGHNITRYGWRFHHFAVVISARCRRSRSHCCWVKHLQFDCLRPPSRLQHSTRLATLIHVMLESQNNDDFSIKFF